MALTANRCCPSMILLVCMAASSSAASTFHFEARHALAPSTRRQTGGGRPAHGFDGGARSLQVTDGSVGTPDHVADEAEAAIREAEELTRGGQYSPASRVVATGSPVALGAPRAASRLLPDAAREAVRGGIAAWVEPAEAAEKALQDETIADSALQPAPEFHAINSRVAADPVAVVADAADGAGAKYELAVAKDGKEDQQQRKAEQNEGQEVEQQDDGRELAAEHEAEAAAVNELNIAAEDDGREDSARKHKVEELEHLLTEETESRALAEMLGSLKKDVYLLNERLDGLHEDLEDGVPLEEPDPAEEIVYPLSTCMWCIVMLATAYVLVYTALALCRAITDFFGLKRRNNFMLALRGACNTIFFAPMLCVLLIATELRALQITKGEETPLASIKLSMEACTGALIVQTCLVLVYPVFTGEAASVGRHVELPSADNRALYGLFTLIRYLSTATLYTGLGVVFVNMLCMSTKTLGVERMDMWDDPKTVRIELAPPLSSPIACIMLLTAVFFLAHLLHAAACTCVELADRAQGERGIRLRAIFGALEGVLRRCTDAVNVSPMMCVLFTVVRLRALQLDPANGNTQWWTSTCFHVATGAVFAHGVCIIAHYCVTSTDDHPGIEEEEDEEEHVDRLSSPLLFAPTRSFSSTLEPGLEAGDVEDTSHSTALGQKILLGIRCAVIVIGVSASLGIVIGVSLLRAPNGPTPALSSTTFCIICLAAMHLPVYLGLYIAQVLALLPKKLSGTTREAWGRAVRTLRAGEYTVKLCPMLGVFFVGARIRVLQLTRRKGEPQCWAQDAMYVSSAAVLVQLIMALTRTAINGEEDSLNDPVAKDGLDYSCGRMAMETLNAFAFLALYGGALVVAASTLAARPETAVCENGSIFA